MPPIFRAALSYWALVFAAGFVLGTARTLWLAPRLGDLAATAIELPLMLAISALAARHVLRRYSVSRASDAFILGGRAFALLLGSEAALALALGRNIGEWAAALVTPAGALGLAGQAGFAVLPAALLALRQGR